MINLDNWISTTTHLEGLAIWHELGLCKWTFAHNYKSYEGEIYKSSTGKCIINQKVDGIWEKVNVLGKGDNLSIAKNMLVDMYKTIGE